MKKSRCVRPCFPARDAYDAAFALIAAATQRCDVANVAAEAAAAKYLAILTQAEAYQCERQKSLGEPEEEVVAMGVMREDSFESFEMCHKPNMQMPSSAGMPDMMRDELALVGGFSASMVRGGGLTVGRRSLTPC